MSGHIEGKWEAVSNLIRTKRDEYGHGGHLVAECPVTSASRKEDAVLIAAAPELLHVVNQLVAMIDGGHIANRGHEMNFIGFIGEIARDAIKKAAGQ